jgi:hypothetical protein
MSLSWRIAAKRDSCCAESVDVVLEGCAFVVSEEVASCAVGVARGFLAWEP